MIEGLFFATILNIRLLMYRMLKILLIKFLFIFNFLFLNTFVLADNHNIYETIEQIQKDIQEIKEELHGKNDESKYITLPDFLEVSDE